jgi:hypothetical protein
MIAVPAMNRWATMFVRFADYKNLMVKTAVPQLMNPGATCARQKFQPLLRH